MTNEAVLKIETHLPINFTCSTHVTIEKGAVVKITNPMTAVLSAGDGDLVAGIVQSEKLAAETSQDSVAVYRGGIFLMTVSGSVSAGQTLATDSSTTGSNILAIAAATDVDTETFGTAMQDHAGAASQILVELNPGVNNHAYS